MTILEALNWGKEQLKETVAQKQSPSQPMIDAQRLLSACLQKPTSYLFSHFEDELKPEIITQYQRYIERRKRHEPISQILQVKGFYGRDFFVNRFVLTPRPETEMLIDLAKPLVQERSTIFDIGTGSGAIAITLAAETTQPVIAVDIDPQALSVAQKNAHQHKVAHLVSFFHGDLLEPVEAHHIQDSRQPHALILANLPYLTRAQWETIDPDVRLYEPTHALVGGFDGLEHYDRLFAYIARLRHQLAQRIDLLIEIDPSQTRPLVRLIKNHLPQAQAESITDLNGRERFLHIVL